MPERTSYPTDFDPFLKACIDLLKKGQRFPKQDKWGNVYYDAPISPLYNHYCQLISTMADVISERLKADIDEVAKEHYRKILTGAVTCAFYDLKSEHRSSSIYHKKPSWCEDPYGFIGLYRFMCRTFSSTVSFGPGVMTIRSLEGFGVWKSHSEKRIPSAVIECLKAFRNWEELPQLLYQNRIQAGFLFELRYKTNYHDDLIDDKAEITRLDDIIYSIARELKVTCNLERFGTVFTDRYVYSQPEGYSYTPGELEHLMYGPGAPAESSMKREEVLNEYMQGRFARGKGKACRNPHPEPMVKFKKKKRPSPYKLPEELSKFANACRKQDISNAKRLDSLEFHDRHLYECPLSLQLPIVPVYLKGRLFDLDELMKIKPDKQGRRRYPLEQEVYYKLSEVQPAYNYRDVIDRLCDESRASGIVTSIA